MTAFCLSSTSRSRPTVFTVAAMVGGTERIPQQPVPPTYSVDTPDDENLEDLDPNEAGGPTIGRPNKKHLPDEEHGIP